MGEGGYVAEFVHDVFQPLMAEIVHKKIKVITNAGGRFILYKLSRFNHYLKE